MGATGQCLVADLNLKVMEEKVNIQVSSTSRDNVKRFIVGTGDNLGRFYERAAVALMEKEKPACKHIDTIIMSGTQKWCNHCMQMVFDLPDNLNQQ